MLKDIEKINEALNVLKKEGEKSYLSQYVDKISFWEKVGQAISKSEGGFDFALFNLIQAVAEDWNYHDVVAMIDLIFRPNGTDFVLNSLEKYINVFMNKTITGTWYDGNLEQHKEKWKITVKIEKEKI